MDYEDELQQMQEDALKELDGDVNDTDTDDTGHEDEYAADTDDKREAEENGEDFSEDGNENESDIERNKREDAESFDDNLDEDDTRYDDDEANDSDTNSEKSNDDFEPVEVNINGQNITLESQEELLDFVKNKGGSSSKRTRKSATDQIVEQGNLSKDDLQLYIDAKNGDPAAIAKIAQNAKIDVYELSDEQAAEYKPKFEAHLMTEVDEVAADIMADKELHTNFQQVVETIPDSFKAEIATNSKALSNFARHVKTGLAQEVIPMVVKEQALKGGDFMELYARIGREVANKDKPAEQSKSKRKVNPRAEQLKKRASNPKGQNKGTKTRENANDIWDMSDEDFKKKYM